MAAVVSLLILVWLSLLINRIATAALVLTGVSTEVARFQAHSAWLGIGFTTGESEQIMNHPVRRRLVLWLMVAGNVGTATVVTSLLLTILRAEQSHRWLEMALWFAAGLVLLIASEKSPAATRGLTRAVHWALRRWTHLDVRDTAGLLRLADDFLVSELRVDGEDWIAERSLASLELHREGVLVLGIERADGTYVGAPTGGTTIHPDDVLVLYGRAGHIAELDTRRAGAAGEAAHSAAVREHDHELETTAEHAQTA